MAQGIHFAIGGAIFGQLEESHVEMIHRFGLPGIEPYRSMGMKWVENPGELKRVLDANGVQLITCSNGGPGQSTLVLAQLIFQRGFEENQFGYASAISVVLFFLCLLVTLVQFAVNRRRNA